MDQDVQAARDKLAARFANQTQIGGKGKTTFRDSHCWLLGPQRLLPGGRPPERFIDSGFNRGSFLL